MVATITPTDAGVRLVSHDGRTWSKPSWSAKRPTAVDVEFAAEPTGTG